MKTSPSRYLLAAAVLLVVVALSLATPRFALADTDGETPVADTTVAVVDTGEQALADADETAVPADADAAGTAEAPETTSDAATEEANGSNEIDETVASEATVTMSALDDASGTPDLTLVLTHVPVYGSLENVLGEIRSADGSTFDPSAYRVTLYVQLSQYGQCWVKPTQATPYVDVLDDGTFVLDYTSGGNDRIAPYLHVLLIPADYTPTVSDLDGAKAHALDYVKIVRSSDGSYTVDPADREQAPHNMASGLAVAEDKIAVDVGLYTSGNPGDELSEQQIRTMLARIAEFSDTVRFYRAGDQEYKAYRIAHELGLNVVGTALLTGNAAQDQAEMDTLIELCNAGYVQVACVGNETLYANTQTPETLIDKINYVREHLEDDTIPVTTSETLGLLIKYPLVRNACDILMPNCYPYWEGKSIDAAVESFQGSLTALAECSPGKEIVVSETGWPTGGEKTGNAVPGEEQARAYFDGIRAWSLDTQTVVLWFAAADEPWKSGSNGEGSVGQHWGLLDTDLNVKDGFVSHEIFSSLSDMPTKLLESDVSVGDASCIYDGSPKKPGVTVTSDGTELVEGKDYRVAYANNTNAGTASVTVEGIGGYTGTVTKTFKIAKASQNLVVRLSASRICIGDEATIRVSGSFGAIACQSGTTRVATVSGTTIRGRAYGVATIAVRARGDANHNAASKSVTIRVICATPTIATTRNVNGGIRVTWKRVTGGAAYRVFCKTGSGSWKQVGDTTGNSLNVRTCDGKTGLVSGKTYTFTVRCILESGSSIYTSGYNSTGKTQTYVATSAIVRLQRSTSSRVLVSWKRVASVTGYRLQYGTDRNFGSGTKTVTISGASSTARLAASLTKGKTYYFRMQAYKTVSGETVYSTWCSVRSVTIS